MAQRQAIVKYITKKGSIGVIIGKNSPSDFGGTIHLKVGSYHLSVIVRKRNALKIPGEINISNENMNTIS